MNKKRVINTTLILISLIVVLFAASVITGRGMLVVLTDVFAYIYHLVVYVFSTLLILSLAFLPSVLTGVSLSTWNKKQSEAVLSKLTIFMLAASVAILVGLFVVYWFLPFSTQVYSLTTWPAAGFQWPDSLEIVYREAGYIIFGVNMFTYVIGESSGLFN